MEPIQLRAERLAAETFLGGPIQSFETVGRLQLMTLLRVGLYPDSKVLDIGCGALRAGYWLINFLEPDCYFGLEPNKDMLDAGVRTFLSEALLSAKRPRFAHNTEFDVSSFGLRFDFFLARSVWTHAPKSQILKMLDVFGASSNESGLFLTSYLPASERDPDYRGDTWVGKSESSREAGLVGHDPNWIASECRSRGLTSRTLPVDGFRRQVWLAIQRQGVERPSDRWLTSLVELEKPRRPAAQPGKGRVRARDAVINGLRQARKILR
ncbi:MAG: class I SAM-dependent methyltransferase [Deltaproteobacteria bacterium]|nr:class I SAM-dependent methyltransferase [Deltaproteobacteria bacterium]